MRRSTGAPLPLSRRRLLHLGAAGVAAALVAACGDNQAKGTESMARPRQSDRATPAPAEGRLLARPLPPAGDSPPLGLQALGLAEGRDGLLYVPAGYRPERPAPLVLMLHGAGGTAEHALWPLQGFADETGMILLAPESRRQTWDVILGRYGPDIAFIDQALAWTFDRYAVDPGRIAIEGFSDGASYALSAGSTNGDLFGHIIAFSPGFAAPASQEGEPRIYVSHGVHDDVLPIDRCSRRLVPRVQAAGYAVRYLEFDGGHWVPPEIAQDALAWFRGERD